MILFGLGNPGRQYLTTRHNVGHLFLNFIARQQHRRFRTYENVKKVTLRIQRKTVYLVKPQCWMNQSGHAIARFLDNHSAQFLIVVDDINLPIGRMRLKAKGSDGGHLGLRSIGEALGTREFARLRFGIGHDENDVVDYVLSTLTRREKAILKMMFAHAWKGLKLFFRKNFDRSQNYINGIDLTEETPVKK